MKIGDFSRGGRTRGDHKACEHDLACSEQYHPFGSLDEDQGQLSLTFGSSAKTSDFIVDTLAAWWAGLAETAHAASQRIQLKVDNGPESRGGRTQFLSRMVQWVEEIGGPIQLLYYPP